MAQEYGSSIKLKHEFKFFRGTSRLFQRAGKRYRTAVLIKESKISLIRNSAALVQAVIATSTKGSHPLSPALQLLLQHQHSHSHHKSSSSVLNHQRSIYYYNTAHLSRTHISNVKMQIFVKTRKFCLHPTPHLSSRGHLNPISSR